MSGLSLILLDSSYNRRQQPVSSISWAFNQVVILQLQWGASLTQAFKQVKIFVSFCEIKSFFFFFFGACSSCVKQKANSSLPPHS